MSIHSIIIFCPFGYIGYPWDIFSHPWISKDIERLKKKDQGCLYLSRDILSYLGMSSRWYIPVLSHVWTSPVPRNAACDTKCSQNQRNASWFMRASNHSSVYFFSPPRPFTAFTGGKASGREGGASLPRSPPDRPFRRPSGGHTVARNISVSRIGLEATLFWVV